MATRRTQTAVQRELCNILHHGHGPTGHAFEFILVMLILVSLSILPLEFLPAFTPYHGTLYVIEIITTSFFTFEYVIRIYAAPNRTRYVLSFFGIVDLLSILPFYLGLLGTQYIRLLRLIRLVRLGEIEAAAIGEEEDVIEAGVGLGADEEMEYIVTRHPIYLFFGCIPPLIAVTSAVSMLLIFPGNPISISIAVTLFLFAISFLWKAWLDYSYDVIYVTSHRLIFQNQHILGRSINQVNYRAIMNVKPFYRGIFSYLCGFGSLIIETPAAEVGHIELHTVRDHEKAAHMIMRRCAHIDNIPRHVRAL